MRRPTGLHQGGARVRQLHAVADAEPDGAGQHQRELVLPGMVVWLHQGPRRDLDLEHGQAAAGIGAFDLVVEPHAEELDGLAFPRCHQLGARARGGEHYGPPWSGWVRVCLPPWSVCLSLRYICGGLVPSCWVPSTGRVALVTKEAWLEQSPTTAAAPRQ